MVSAWGVDAADHSLPQRAPGILTGVVSFSVDLSSGATTVILDDGSTVTSIDAQATHPQAWIRRRAAFDGSCPREILGRLAQDSDDSVRAAVATNPQTPLPILEELLTDPSPLVRRACAQPLLPAGHLATLASDTDPKVRAAACEHLTDAHLLATAASDRKAEVRTAVAANPRTPTSVHAPLSHDKSKAVRRALAANPSADPAALEVLAADKVAEVRESAWLNPAAPTSVRIQALRTARTRRQAAHLTGADIRAAVEDDANTVKIRAEGMVLVAKEDGPAILEDAYRSQDPRRRRIGLRAIASHPHDVNPDLLVEIVQASTHEHLSRPQLGGIITAIAHHDGHEHLYETFAFDYPEPVREAAISVFDRVRDVQPESTLHRFAVGDIDACASSAVYELFRRRAGELVEDLYFSTEPRLRARVLEVLNDEGDRAMALEALNERTLCDVITSPGSDRALRAAAITRHEEISPEPVVPGYLHHNDPKVRAAAQEVFYAALS